MKFSLTVLVLLLLLLNILAGCAPGPNHSKGVATDHGVAGFWLGLWQEFIAPFVFVVSLFKATSVSTRSTTTERGTTLATCSA
jgi:hypothetical protein